MVRHILRLVAAVTLALGCYADAEGMVTVPGPHTVLQSPVAPGPIASEKLFVELAEQDRKLFDLVFVRCDPDQLAEMLADDFEFYHDKFGKVASSPAQFVANIRTGCEAQRAGTNVRARRELIEGSMVVYPINNYGAIQAGSHRFFGIEGGKPDTLRETGKFFHLWTLEDRKWQLSRVFSFDHHPAQ
jgi:hypothetical protein